MNTNSKVTVTSLLALALIATALPAQQVTAPAETSTNDEVAPVTTVQNSAPASANSKVRIVRLSDVKGVVHLHRDTGRGFEQAMPSLPIVERTRLQTGAGVAEVEFEDNSTL